MLALHVLGGRMPRAQPCGRVQVRTSLVTGVRGSRRGREMICGVLPVTPFLPWAAEPVICMIAQIVRLKLGLRPRKY